jgi:pimeloyl-ACP methyl ester carboxylesterase
MKRFNLMIVLLLPSLYSIAQSNPKLAIKVYKRDTLFNCIAADSLGNVYTASSQKGVFKFDGTVWKDWTGGSGAAGVRKSFMKHMAGGREGVWLTHSGYVLTVTGGGSPPISYNNANGGVEYIPAAHPAQRVKYQGRPIIARSLVKGPATKSGLAIAIDKNGTVWSGTNYADSQRYYFYDGFTVYPDRYYYSPGGLTYKTAGGAGFDTVVAGMPWPAGINISIGTDYQTENWSIGKRRTVRAVGVLNSIDEVWASVDSLQAAGQTFSNCILRYSLAGAYLGKIDNTGTGLPMGAGTGYAGATSIYEDAKGRIWLGFGNKGLGVKDSTGNWTYIPAPPLLPANTQIRPNAITGNKNGEVYFGTTNGLYVYRCVKGNYTQDSSYKLFTVADSLPSNNILGVTIDKAGSIWLATSSGVAKINKGSLSIYGIDNSDGNIAGRISYVNKFLMTTCGDCRQDETIMIAADSSEATQFEFEYSGNPDDIVFALRNKNGETDPNNADLLFREKYGWFENSTAKKKYQNGKIKWIYHHPLGISGVELDTDKKGVTISFEILKNGVSIDYMGNGRAQKLKIVYPPVLFVHGLWDHGNAKAVRNKAVYGIIPLMSWGEEKGCFDEMYDKLLSNGNYNRFQLWKVDYEATHNASFNVNKEVVSKYIDLALDNCYKNNLSAGKVDIVSHSMGGDLSRRYLQSSDYLNDINKLITLNTPHAGSQVANWYTLNGRVMPAARSFAGLGCGFALRDLRVNFEDRVYNGPITEMNQFVQRDRSKNAALHAVATTANRLSQFDQTGPAGLFESVTYNAANQLITPGNFLAVLAARKSRELFFKGTECTYADRAVECFKKLYKSNNAGGDNDNAVGVVSQRGGLFGNAVTVINDVAHSESPHNINVINRVVELLKTGRQYSEFSSTGYGSVVLTHYQKDPKVPETDAYECPGTGNSQIYPNGRPATSSRIKIISPVAGTNFAPLDTVTVRVETDTVYGVQFQSYNPVLDAAYDIRFDTTKFYEFKYIIPKQAVGKIDLFATGYDTTGYVATDSSFINIGIPAGVTLNSIKVVNRDSLQVYKNDSIVVRILGVYSDTTREITYLPGFTYSFEEARAAGALYGIKGVIPGLDRLFVTYQGKRDTAYVEVVDAPLVINPVPVTFSDIYALYRNGRIEVNWSTETEINNKEFEVQRSIDGTRFETFATVPGKTFSSSTSWYNAPDYNFSNGRNFYRIKQVDLDGNYKYSKVVLVLVKDKSTVLLYPNPARSEVNIVLSASANAGAVRLVNTLGQQVLLKQVASNRQTVALDISQLQTGVYFTEVLDKNNKRIWGGVFVKE